MLRFRAPWSAILILALHVASSPRAHADVGYRLTDLGTLGGTDSFATAINDAGQITGFSLTAMPKPGSPSYTSCGSNAFEMDTYRHAFLHTPGGSMVDLGTLGGLNSWGQVINGSGDVAGTAETPTAAHSFLYSAGVMTDLDTPPLHPPHPVWVRGINSSQEVVGWYASSIPEDGVLYSGGPPEMIPPLDPGTPVKTFAIDDSNQVFALGMVGGEDHIIGYQGGVTSDLYALPSGFSQLVAGNSLGEAIVSGNIGGAHGWHLFRAGSFTHIDFPAGSTVAFAVQLNHEGDVVGFFNPPESQQSHGFFFDTDTGTFRDLDELVVNSTGLVVAAALAINNVGQIAACAWDGATVHAVRLDPFDPDLCGNDVPDFGEQCDDGDLIDGDGCDSNCTPTGCGNGVVTSGEQCDDGNPINGDGCSITCEIAFTECGNLFVDPGEACDDGNFADGDGCDGDCTETGCGNAIVTAGEQCDDGNIANGDGCSSACSLEAPGLCGNGSIDPGETCDDGNLAGDDGCGASCQLEMYPDVRGTWQITFDFSLFADAKATRFIEITEENLSTGVFRATLGFSCGSNSIGGHMYLNSDCSISPATIVGSLRGASGLTLHLPSVGSFLSDETAVTPFPFGSCSSVARTQIEFDATGTLTVVSGAVVRVDGSSTALARLKDPNGELCGEAGAPPTFAMLRNDVPTGSNVEVQPVDGASITFESVASSGSAGVVILTEPAASIPANFTLTNGTVADVITNADVSGGSITTCLSYPDANSDGIVDGTSPPMPESELKILHDESGLFVDRTVSRDPISNVICALTSSLSQFALGSGAAPVGCPSAPEAGCTAGFGGRLQIKERVVGKEKLIAKLSGGPSLGQTDFGNPIEPPGTVYTLCLYDDVGGLAGELEVPPGTPSVGWTPIGGYPDGVGYRYTDKNATADGVIRLQLKGGPADKAKLQVKAKNNISKGQNALPAGIALSLSATESVTMQLHASGAGCFSTTLSDIVKQGGDSFKAK